MYREYPTFQFDEILVYLRKSRSDDPMLSVEEILAEMRSSARARNYVEKTVALSDMAHKSGNFGIKILNITGVGIVSENFTGIG